MHTALREWVIWVIDPGFNIKKSRSRLRTGFFVSAPTVFWPAFRNLAYIYSPF
jgi:hypothetical protein